MEEESTSNQRKRRESLTYSEDVRSNRESVTFINPNIIEHEGSLHAQISEENSRIDSNHHSHFEKEQNDQQIMISEMENHYHVNDQDKEKYIDLQNNQ
jgi:TolA-binding protein